MGFSVQYTSLILILLTFLIGTFIKPEQVEAVHVPVVEAKPVSLAVFNFKSIFEEGAATLNQDDLVGISEVLQQHDVEAEVELFDSSATLLVARIMSLKTYFSDNGVLESAINITARQQEADMQLHITLTRSQSYEQE